MEEINVKEGEELIRSWYALIDAKADFHEIAARTAGEELVVDFPGNPLKFEGFKMWYQNQCLDYTGRHEIHSTQVTEEGGLLVIFARITWTAVDRQGKTVVLYPDVTIKWKRDNGWKAVYYGCVDRE